MTVSFTRSQSQYFELFGPCTKKNLNYIEGNLKISKKDREIPERDS